MVSKKSAFYFAFKSTLILALEKLFPTSHFCQKYFSLAFAIDINILWQIAKVGRMVTDIKGKRGERDREQ